MKLVVIIASFGRPSVLTEMLRHLEGQTRRPDLVIVSLADEGHGPEQREFCYDMRTVIGEAGSCVQRNAGLRLALPSADIITFFDDDFAPADSYLERIESAFSTCSDYVAIHGNVVADGISGRGLNFAEARQALKDARHEVDNSSPRITEDTTTYGCNMSFRANKITPDMTFDERLGPYAWQEDRDFSYRVGRLGRVVKISNIVGVHLGVKGGRVRGIRFGYSQVVNPIYLMRKGTMPLPAAGRLMTRNLIANAVRSFHPEPWVDRRGRLKGNLIGLGHVITGRVEPDYVLKL